MKIVRIESDGSPEGTKVFNELGEEVINITSIKWEISAKSLATVTISLIDVAVIVKGKVEE